MLVASSVVAWNAYEYWQKDRSTRACALFEELEKATRSGDLKKTEQVFADVKERFASTVCADQSAFLAAKTFYLAGNVDAAKAALRWSAEKSSDKAYATLARLRWSALLLDTKAYDEALAVLAEGVDDNFAALVADRKGDIYQLQGKGAQAKAEYEKALSVLNVRAEYRQLVAAKLSALPADAVAVKRVDGASKTPALK